jgi:hypothetical protein
MNIVGKNQKTKHFMINQTNILHNKKYLKRQRIKKMYKKI